MNPHASTSRSERGTYQVVIGVRRLRPSRRALAEHGIDRQRLVVSAPPIWRLQGARLRDVIGPKERPTLIPDGERAKTLATVARIYDACVRRGLDRSGAIVAFGGGVVGDVAGFAAATYLRGIRAGSGPDDAPRAGGQLDRRQGRRESRRRARTSSARSTRRRSSSAIPTCSRLAAAAASSAPACTRSSSTASSPRRALFDRVADGLTAIFNRDGAVLTPLVADCCRIKAHVVMADERESGLRRILNFGHTVGHALEAITEYRRFRHGEAIGYGMLAAARLSTHAACSTRRRRIAAARCDSRHGPAAAGGGPSDRRRARRHRPRQEGRRGPAALRAGRGIGATRSFPTSTRTNSRWRSRRSG